MLDGMDGHASERHVAYSPRTGFSGLADKTKI